MMEKLTPHIKKQTTFMREPLEVGLKLAATLRFLANGNSYPLYSTASELKQLQSVSSYQRCALHSHHSSFALVADWS